MKSTRRPADFEAAEELLPRLQDGPASRPHNRFNRKIKNEITGEKMQLNKKTEDNQG